MRHISKRVYTVALTIILIAFLCEPILAHTAWIDGIVTKKAWTEKYQHIEVDNVKYTFMPNVLRITAPRKTLRNRSDKQIINSIKEGQNVSIRIQGHRIYEIIINSD
jgi:hypothetical protein